MKKILTIIITVLFCFAFCGCSDITESADRQNGDISTINYEIKYKTKFLELTLRPSETIWIDTDYIISVSPHIHCPYVYSEEENRYVTDNKSEEVLGSKIVLLYGEKVENIYVLENPQTVMHYIG